MAGGDVVDVDGDLVLSPGPAGYDDPVVPRPVHLDLHALGDDALLPAVLKLLAQRGPPLDVLVAARAPGDGSTIGQTRSTSESPATACLPSSQFAIIRGARLKACRGKDEI